MIGRLSGRALIVASFVVGTALFVVPGAYAQDEGTLRLESLNRAMSHESGWRATFEQEYIPAGMDMGEKAEGLVWLAWPDRALFHTGNPPFRLMGLSGRTVRLVDLDDETCDEHVLTDREWERVPLAAVLDPRGAELHFTVEELGSEGIVLTPREAGGVDRVELILGGLGLPIEVVIGDPQGAVNRLIFDGWTPSTAPPDERWLPDPPSGVECVADPGTLD